MTSLHRPFTIIARHLSLSSFLCAGIFLSIPLLSLFAQNDPDSADLDLPITSPFYAPGSGSFGIFAGPSLELTSLKTTDLDPDLDEFLLIKGGYGYVILSEWIIGGGWGSVSLDEPDNIYQKFEMGFGGFMTGYDKLLSKKVSARLSLLVGGGDITMIKKRPDLASQGDHEFLERYREEDFFLLHPEISIGYHLLSFIDLRLAAAYWYPLGSSEAEDLRQFTYGIHFMFGFRNNIWQ